MEKQITYSLLEDTVSKVISRKINEGLLSMLLGFNDSDLDYGTDDDNQEQPSAQGQAPAQEQLPAVNNGLGQNALAYQQNVPGIVGKVANMTILKAPYRYQNGAWAYDKKTNRAFGYGDYGGVCARGVGIILNAFFGIPDYATCGIGDGGVNVMKNPKFQYVATVSPSEGFPNAQPGDVAIYQGNGKHHAQICLDGTTWASDTIQRKFDCYGGKCPTAYIYRIKPQQQQQQPQTSVVAEAVVRQTKKLLKESGLLGALLGFDDDSLEDINYDDASQEQTQQSGSNPNETTNPTSVQQPSTDGVSPAMTNMISKWETGHDFGYAMSSKDFNGYNDSGTPSFGYGLKFDPYTKQYMYKIQSQWTQPELEDRFKKTLSNTANLVKNWAGSNNISLSQNQLDAMVSGCYNYGYGGFMKQPVCKLIAQNPNDPRIPQMWSSMSANNSRRRGEAAWYQAGMSAQA